MNKFPSLGFFAGLTVSDRFGCGAAADNAVHGEAKVFGVSAVFASAAGNLAGVFTAGMSAATGSIFELEVTGL